MRQYNDYSSFEGFEVWFHRLQMRSKMVLFISLIILILYTPLFIFIAKKMLLSHQDVLNFKPFLQSMFYDFFQPTKKLQVAFCKNGICKKGFADAADVFLEFRDHYWWLIYKLLFKFLIGYIFFWIPCIILFLKKFGREAYKLHQEKIMRGVKIQSEKSLKKQLKKYGRSDKDLPLSKNLCLPYQLENRHVFIVGSTGTGKTTLLKNVLLKLRERDEKVVIFDIKGDFLSCFYDPEKDYVLNPLDSRCVPWNIFNDLKSDRLSYSFAASIIPEGYGENKYFHDTSRDLFSDILCILRRQNSKNKDVWNVINSTVGEIYALIKDFDGVGKAHIQKLDSNQTAGIISTLAQYTRIFRELYRIDGDFSLRDWLKKYNQGFLFLSVPPNYFELLKPLVSAVINLLITEILSFTDDLHRRIFFVVDELGALQKMPSLIDGLTLGRSKGMSFWIGIQDFGKIDHKYGRNIRETLWNNCITKVIFRVDAPDTTQYLANAIGQSEVEEAKKSHSMGVEDNRDGLSIARQTQIKYALLPSEIQQISDLTCLIKMLNFAPAYPCHIEIPNIHSVHSPFIEIEEEEEIKEENVMDQRQEEIKKDHEVPEHEEKQQKEEQQEQTEEEEDPWKQAISIEKLQEIYEKKKKEQKLLNNKNDKKEGESKTNNEKVFI